MIATVLNVDPIKESFVVVVIQPDNLKRMRRADPITLETVGAKTGGGIMPVVKYPESLSILIAYEEDEPALWKICQSNDPVAMMKYLQRGLKFNRDEDGAARAFSLNKGREAEKL